MREWLEALMASHRKVYPHLYREQTMTEKYNAQNDLISDLIHENHGLQTRINENLLRIDSLRGIKSLPASQRVDELTTPIPPQPWKEPIYPARWFNRVEHDFTGYDPEPAA